MTNAPRKQSDTQEPVIPYFEPDFCEEPMTEPRIRTQLLIPTEQSGVVPRARAALTEAQRAVSRLRFAPALLIGAVIGSAPYLVHQHLRSHSVDELRTLSQGMRRMLRPRSWQQRTPSARRHRSCTRLQPPECPKRPKRLSRPSLRYCRTHCSQ